jgi:3-hydroxybutyryl-CoA dehydrogenase
MSTAEIRKVGVLGAGQMGRGIAQVSAQSGYETILVKATPGDTTKIQEKILGGWDRLVSKGRMEQADRDAAAGRITVTTDFDQLGSCDLIVESIIEDLDIKHDAFARLDAICGESTIFSSNTSTLGITEMAVKTKRPERFVGLHFFNPAPAMKLVEVAKTLRTDADVTEAARAFAESCGKTPVVLNDSTGFVVNRLLVPYMIDAMIEWQRGNGSIDGIDTAMCNGAAHPMGPFTLADFIGLDVVHEMANNLYEEYGEARFAPPPILRRLLLAGQLGRKTKLGFYDYADRPAVVNPALTR